MNDKAAVDKRLTLGITIVIPKIVKTAISFPDAFSGSRTPRRRAGVSRSEFYICALRPYLDRIDESSITERLDSIYADVDQSPDFFQQRATFLTLARAEIGMNRGEILWVDLAPPDGWEPGYRRPVLVVQFQRIQA